MVRWRCICASKWPTNIASGGAGPGTLLSMDVDNASWWFKCLTGTSIRPEQRRPESDGRGGRWGMGYPPQSGGNKLLAVTNRTHSMSASMNPKSQKTTGCSYTNLWGVGHGGTYGNKKGYPSSPLYNQIRFIVWGRNRLLWPPKGGQKSLHSDQ